MPRSTISLQPIDPPTPIADGSRNAIASILDGITRRRELEMQQGEMEYQRERQARNDALAERRMALEQERYARGDSLAERRMNEDRERYGQRLALDKEDLNYRRARDKDADTARQVKELLDLKKSMDGKAGGTGKPAITLKDARTLAVEQAYKEATADEFGTRKPIDPKRVDYLTEYLMKYGTMPPVDGTAEPVAVAPPEGQVDPVVPPRGERRADRWGWANTAWDAVTSMFDSEPSVQAPAEPVAVAPPAAPRVDEVPQPTSMPDERRESRRWMLPRQNERIAGKRVTNESQGQVQEAVSPNVPDPDPRYLDQLDIIGKSDPQKLVDILRALKARSPEEFFAVDRAIRARRAAAPVAKE